MLKDEQYSALRMMLLLLGDEIRSCQNSTCDAGFECGTRLASVLTCLTLAQHAVSVARDNLYDYVSKE